MASPDDAPARNAARWREYPAHCSSAPCPSRSTRARDAYGIRTPSAPSAAAAPRRARLFGEQFGRLFAAGADATSIQPSPLAASHSAAPMLRSITVRAGRSRPASRAAGRPRRTSSTSASTRTSRQARAGKSASSSAAPSSAAARSGDRPPSKHTLMRSTARPGGTYLCASAASSMLSTPPENKTPMNARPSGGSEVPFPRGASATLSATRRSAAAASAATNPSTAASRAVFFSSFTSVSLSSVSPRADASSVDARSTAGRVAARARRNRRRRSASAPLFFFFFFASGTNAPFSFPAARARPRNTARARAPPIRLFRGLGFPARRTTGRVPSREARRRVARRRRGRARRRAGGAGCAGRRRRARTTGAWTPRASTPEPTGPAAGRRARMRRGLHRLEPAREDLVERREQRRGVVLGAGGGSGDAAEDLPENARTFPRTSTRGRRSGCCRGAGAGSRGCGSPSEALRPGAGARGGTPTRLCQAPTPSGPLLRMKSGTGGEAERVPSSHADRKTSIPHSVPVVRGRRGGAVERARRRRRSRDARGDRRARDECRGKRKRNGRDG